MPRPSPLLLLPLALFATGNAQASCGQAFCVVNTNWAMQGVPADVDSSRLDLRYEVINQNQLRQGKRNISPAEDDGDTVERHTFNRNLVASYDYTFSERWNLAVSVPLQQREHDHVADPSGAASYEQWNFTKLSDVKALASYRFANEEDPLNHFGLQFGVKLPTGSHSVANADGTRAERALQPGSGSTDAIVGGYYTHRGLSAGAAWFVQGSQQQAVSTRDDFRPGSVTSLTVGYRQPVSTALSATVQANALRKGRDSGAQAEPDLSGGRYLFLSPGLSYALTQSTQAYAYAQLPLQRNVNGIQLTASRAVVAGLTLQF